MFLLTKQPSLIQSPSETLCWDIKCQRNPKSVVFIVDNLSHCHYCSKVFFQSMIFNYIKPPLPIITPCIKFELAPPLPLPIIMPCIEFDLGQLAQQMLDNHQSANQEAQGELRGSDQDLDQPPSALSQALPSSKIPKPPGEPGRPGLGGFCMETTLVDTHHWNEEAVNNFSVWKYQILGQCL